MWFFTFSINLSWPSNLFTRQTWRLCVHRTVHAWYPIDYRQKQPKSTVFGWLLFILFAFPWKFESDLNEYYTWIWIKPSWRSKFTQYMNTRILCCQMRHTLSLLCTQWTYIQIHYIENDTCLKSTEIKLKKRVRIKFSIHLIFDMHTQQL